MPLCADRMRSAFPFLFICTISCSADTWVTPKGFGAGHNGGFQERLVEKAAAKQPHIVMVLWDDYGWADAGWHRNYTGPGGIHVDATAEIQTPHLNNLVAEGIELDRNYVRAPPTSLRLSHR